MVALLAGCATETEWPEGQGFRMNPKLEAQCKAEGGCVMVSAHWFQQQMLKAFTAGAESVVEEKPPKDSL